MAVVDILPPEPAAKHVRRAHRGGGSVTDADFVTLRPKPLRDRRFETQNDNRRTASGAKPAAAASPPAALVERVERLLSRLSADMFSAVVAAAFLVVFGLAGGFSLFVGQGNGPVEAPTLDITHVTVTPQEAEGMPVLLINGIVENRGRTGLNLPSIRADLFREGALLSSTLINPPVSQMQSGHSHGFSVRIPHPGGKTPELKLSFAGEDASRS
ncbi:hypothetical protein ABID21_003214 [Pseudorhizobium tarimense]|uniref:DUF3426 domain-containing protein n=2 Tax=Pseudorhizobium tarimense TaxID=1079109 RepID=A0ABV2HA67_9HYPH